MNKNLLIGLALVFLAILGYLALSGDNNQPVNESTSMMMEEMPESGLELIQDNVNVPFNELYSITDDWKIKVIQFEPHAKINGTGIIVSDSDEEVNPAVKINFYENDELIHYQICFKEMPGFHSVKKGQLYLIDLLNYDGFKILGDGKYSIDSINIKVWRIK
jgi:hypothetical protein